MASVIRWKKGDYISLGKAVSQFNKKINELEKEGKKLYLPEPIEYKEVKENIISRQELKRVINSLRRFQRSGAEDIYTTKSGEKLTKWERQELSIQSRIASARLNKELKSLNIPQESGYSRAQMGSVRVREIEAQIRNLKSIENKTGYEFTSLKSRLKIQGRSDYNLRKAITYRNNYFDMIKIYSNFSNYDKFIEVLNSYKNPEKFYEFISQNELLSDITYMYDMGMDMGVGSINDESKFNLMLESLGIEI